MKTNLKRVELNRAVFAARPLASRALTVLTTIFHRFTEAGDYEVFILNDGQVVQRHHLSVVTENGPYQFNLDLTADNGGNGLTLNVGGVIGFYASSGTGSYIVRVQQLTSEEKRTVLDSEQGVPAGDLFSITLVQPGAYQVRDSMSGGTTLVRVGMPTRAAPGDVPADPALRRALRFRPDKPSLITFEGGKFSADESSIMSGQTIVIQCLTTAQLVVEPAPAEPGLPPDTGLHPPVKPPLERPKFTLRKPTKIIGREENK